MTKSNLIKNSIYLALYLIILLTLQPCYAQDGEEQKYQSVEERRIFALIQEERDKLEQEKKDMDLREKELKTLSVSVDKKIAEIDTKLEKLENLQKKIEALLAEKSVEEKKRVKDLAVIYEKMSPDRAALAMNGMDPALATDILANMKAKAAAKVLNMLDKQKTSQLSTRFTTIPIE